MSQETLSENIISRRNLSKIENNETSPTLEQLKQIFFKLNIDSNDINVFVLNFNSSQYDELHTEFTDLINSVNIKNSDLLILNQKIKEDLSSDRKIISLYLEFKIRFKNNKLILPLTTKKIRSIYDYLVASPIYTILALLVKLAPMPMIEHLHNKMFPVEFRDFRNQAITDVILCFYFNISSELIQLQ
ncbi:helix-turn-helix domain-containing protein [Carnobacterium divergens]|uniref:helix-turn-helix domain-containing protein n=1 Tax=Carnobacterium divergens TaxID=2748 RepID=UPI002891BA06|nr:helix-turn-helix transcriptional regulator [Carnobacterium divergens]MDT2012882.1 helix-turn-helix domain-containing protein [Carnobacterium divergens]